jgi:tetratricopeptide (TPR) repeat protein
MEYPPLRIIRAMEFRFELPNPPEGPLVEMSPEEMESRLLKRLDEEKNKPVDALWQLARFYQHSKRPDKALDCLRRVLAEMPDAERKASCVLGMGQMMETAGDFQSAIKYYKEAFALEPVQTDVWYFIHNNLGYSLNQLGQFSEGERYCRKAIEINSLRPNAHKNLGLALQGQSEYREAARCFVKATQVNAADPRALGLLESLLKQHPEMEFEFENDVKSCREAIAAVARQAQQLKPVVYRGWRKQLILLRAKVSSLFRRSR